jgi:hypothetical protein
MSADLTRRAFAERLALAVAAPFVLEDLPAPAPPAPPAPPASLASQGQDQEPSALAKALAESIRVRYGDRLSAEDVQTITRGIDSRLRNLERLYRVPLANSDEPDFIFSVFRGDD